MATKATKAPDVLIANDFSVFVFTPMTARAKQWFETNIESEPWQWMGASLVVDRRFAWGLGQGLKDAGLVVE